MSNIQVNKDLCIGCGACESLCPKIFRLEDGKSSVISQDCEKCGCDIQEAIDNCPVGAISKE